MEIMPEPVSMSLRSKLAPNIEQSLTVHGHPGDGLMWELAMTVMPTPDGNMALVGFLVIIAKSLIIGESLAAPVQVDLLSLLDYDTCDRTVMQALTMIREARASMAAPSNGGSMPGGLITP